MAEQAANKTEQPTADRLRDARREGRVANSQELPSVAILCAFLFVLQFYGARLLSFFTNRFHDGLLGIASATVTAETCVNWIRTDAVVLMTLLAPLFMLVVVVGFFSSTVVGGVVFAPKALKWKLTSLNPVNGFKQLFSGRSMVKALLGVGKLAIVMAMAVSFVWANLGVVSSLGDADPWQILTGAGHLALGLSWRVAIAFAVLALIEARYQKWKHRHDRMMTKQEVKEEHKRHEGSPEVKRRIRQVQFEQSRRRIMAAVAKADVVVANPTHFAVALKYDVQEMSAPTVVAKGADYLAQKIKEIARANGVPVMERPRLARLLYQLVDEGQQVPEKLFAAVAEVLAMVYRAGQKARGRPR